MDVNSCVAVTVRGTPVVVQMLISQADRDRNTVTRPQSKYDSANDGYVAEQKAIQAQLTKQTVFVECAAVAGALLVLVPFFSFPVTVFTRRHRV